MVNLRKLPRTEFAAAVAQIAGERRIDAAMIIKSVKLALIAAYKKDAKERGEEIDENQEYDVNLSPESGDARIMAIEEDGKKKDITPPGFGRIAAQTAKQVIIQNIREAEKEAIFKQFSPRVGTLITGTILRIDPFKVTVGIGKAEAIMPKVEQTPGERYQPTDKMSFYFKEIAEANDKKEMILSRRDPGLVVELFRREVPEVSLGNVEIKRIAREAGKRTKVAVASLQPGIDPVGSCVGQSGVRVHEVIDELHGEKIDVIAYSENISQLILAALSPAEGGKIKEIDEKKKIVIVMLPEDKLALAVGLKGGNIRLASELAGYDIKVVSEEEGKKKKETKNKKKAIVSTKKKAKKSAKKPTKK